MKTVIEELANAITARANCIANGNHMWRDNWEVVIARIEGNMLPSGAGVDNGCKVDLAACKPELVVITLGFHHMNDGGYYDGWTEHTCRITPSFTNNINITIGGRNRNDIKDYLSELLYHSLTAPMPEEVVA